MKQYLMHQFLLILIFICFKATASDLNFDAPPSWSIKIYSSEVSARGDLTKCKGVLIKKAIVLTAAHCVYFIKSRNTFLKNLYLQSLRIKIEEQLYSAIDIMVHPKYTNTAPFEHDIAIIYLESKSQNINIQFPSLKNSKSIKESENLFVINNSDYLLDDINRVDIIQPVSMYETDSFYQVTSQYQMCEETGEKRKGASSGSALYQKLPTNEAKDVLLGIHSNSYACKANSDYNYVKIADYYDWINRNTSDALPFSPYKISAKW
jgi:V8-like Glu-specific endopeptidase